MKRARFHPAQQRAPAAKQKTRHAFVAVASDQIADALVQACVKMLQQGDKQIQSRSFLALDQENRSAMAASVSMPRLQKWVPPGSPLVLPWFEACCEKNADFKGLDVGCASKKKEKCRFQGLRLRAYIKKGEKMQVSGA